jgi:dCTP deaminase
LAILADNQIRELVKNNKLKIENFDENLLQPCSYDIRLGKEVFIASEDGERFLGEGESFKISPGDYVIVTTHERLELPLNIYGRVGLKTTLSLKGLINLSGPHVDPGFKGALYLGLSNFGPRPITLRAGDPAFTIEFEELHEPASASYKGRMQNQQHIPSFLIDQLRGLHTESLPGLFNRMSSLENNFNLLKVALDGDMKNLVDSQKQSETSILSRIDTLRDVLYLVLLPLILANFAALLYVIFR